MADSDAELVARVIATDDPSAFAQLVKRHQSPVRNFFRRLTGHDAALADDLAQEAFLRVFRSIGDFEGKARFATWLYRIAYNVFLDDRRRRIALLPLEHAENVEDALLAGNADDEIDADKLLQQLSERQRAIFDLHYRKDMSHQDVADALDIPLGTVKSDLSRGLDHLRQLATSRGEGHE